MTTTPTAATKDYRSVHEAWIGRELFRAGITGSKANNLAAAYLHALFDGEAFRTPTDSLPMLSLVRKRLADLGVHLPASHSQVMYSPLLKASQNEWSK